MNKRIKRYLEEIEKTEKKIGELQAYLKGLKVALKQEEDNEIIKSIRSKKYSSQELLHILAGIQEGTLTIADVEQLQKENKDDTCVIVQEAEEVDLHEKNEQDEKESFGNNRFHGDDFGD